MTLAQRSQLAKSEAEAIADAYADYQRHFERLTLKARSRFENQDWASMRQDGVERLSLYKGVVDRIVADLHELLRQAARDKVVWTQMRESYSSLIAGRDDVELAETFFNSVTRRIFATVGVDPRIEYVAPEVAPPGPDPAQPIYKRYPGRARTAELVLHILQDFSFRPGYQDPVLDAQLAATEIDTHLRSALNWRRVEAADMLPFVFYRGKGAYLIGRLRQGLETVPVVFALLNKGSGVFVDAVLLTENEVSILFSFTRSYFRVAAARPRELIDFLKSLMPRKPIAELYTAIGYHKHGKTELYRDLIQHLANSADQFKLAEGEKGMVMSVFTMPSYDVVFKVIKDRFSAPKTITRQEVMAGYELVFKHDRAGRLVDAQEFEHLKFARDRFAGDLLAELQEVASRSVSLDDDSVIIRHLYTERRLTPLNLYLRQVDEAAAGLAVLDYGQAIKDLAVTNIFPGDLLLKNFGVTRHGRVVFYDYDELCLLTDCCFRQMPQSRHDDDELAAEPWFSIGPRDIFPEEFERFLGLPPSLRQIFVEAHRDLFGITFWQEMQERHRAGEIVDILPYQSNKRLKWRG